ncbi:uncharacterized protein LOC117645463 [Thrips palmi]|uniref:Uncharacterized protein LOC117645463 n=1 Tax=Thrips palmi TaxID=161013 RepID=A0A6P8YVL5_THRPL|nr:uncharacterized protein LOC117645463 [Thrips palmi]XP_034241566.1 uncharacterized protein LOC117645463 [Thrips palmi]
MSQDLFADEEDNVYLFDTTEDAVEFSGISGSGTSSSPGSQQLLQTPAPTPAPAPEPASSSKRQEYPCTVCKKVLKTLKGFEGHIARHAQTTGPETSTTRASTVKAVPPSSKAQAEKLYNCTECKSKLKTKSGFVRHRAAHKMKNALQLRPAPSEFLLSYLPDIIKKIILDIKAEPSGGSSKALFLSQLIEMSEDDKWLNFVQDLGNFISGIVLEKQAKVLPANQYEEMQKKLNSYLNDNIENLGNKLKQLCPVEIDCSLAQRLVFRIATKLLQETQIWAMQKMRPTFTEEDLVLQQEMSESEEKSFLGEIGGLLRSFFMKSLQQSNQQSQMQSQCIKETFVDGPHPISRSQFLIKTNWFSGEDECITVSYHAAHFLKKIELEIIPASVNPCSSEEVVENVLAFQELLDHWYHLTKAYFSEENSLLFLRKIIASYVKLSVVFEEKRGNRLEEKSVRASTAPLRTHLQHNLLEREEEDEDLI